jgi:acetolactate synthase I/II/III large subunit
MSTVAQVIINMLAVNGIDRVFCVPGESYLPVLDALFDERSIDVVTCRHEGSAGYMALTDARLTGRPGVCMVSRGPGAMNAAIALHTAEQDCLPLLLLIGQVPRKNLRRNAFQEIDYGKMFVDIAKWTTEVTDPSRIGEVLARAFQSALSGTPGPVVISLPEDLLEELADSSMPPPYRLPSMSPGQDSVEAIAELLRASQRPLLIAGGQLASDRGRQALLGASEQWHIPTVVSFRRQDLFPNAHDLYAGDLGLAVTDGQLQAFQESDLLLAVGVRFDDLTTQGYAFPDMPKARQRLVHVHDDPKHVGMHCYPDLGVICNPVSFLADLAAVDPGDRTTDSGWMSRLRKLQTAKSTWKASTASDGVVFGNVVSRLSDYLTKDAIVVADAGLSAAMLYQYIAFRPPQILLATFAATMGCGVANAVGAAMRFPQRQVVCVAGDGGFIMSAIELGLAVDRQLSIRFIVSNNGSYGSIRRDQEKAFPHRVIGTDLSNPQFEEFARSFGCKAFVIEREERIDSVMVEAFAVQGPSFIEVKSSLLAALPPLRSVSAQSVQAT